MEEVDIEKVNKIKKIMPSDDLLFDIAEVFKVFGDTTRMKIISALLEAELCVVEMLSMPHIYIDSKQWQRELLPQGIKGSAELKKASKDIGSRLFPLHTNLITKHKDADGILIAYWARMNQI